MRDGGRVAFDVYAGPLKKRWVAEMSGCQEGRQFVDTQLGPVLVVGAHAPVRAPR